MGEPCEPVDDICKWSHSARELTPEEIAKLKKDVNLVTDFKRDKFEKEAQKNWDLFYKRNTTKFFKDRHWITREFHDLLDEKEPQNKQKKVFEVGCGVGNFLFPLMEETNLFFYACDFSKRAVDFVKENEKYDDSRCKVFVCDITEDDPTENIPSHSVDIVTLIFVLSAIHPDKMLIALKNLKKVLKADGCLLIRDYGLYDYAMLRFAPGHKLADHFYVRQDGTRAYYFSTEFLSVLMQNAGFQVCHLNYVKRDTINKKEGICVPRIFVQGKCLVKNS